jgi:predicted DNA-binding protein (MmcQ/YjbR family)
MFETFPFGDDVLVCTVSNKIFALISWRNELMMINSFLLTVKKMTNKDQQAIFLNM